MNTDRAKKNFSVNYFSDCPMPLISVKIEDIDYLLGVNISHPHNVIFFDFFLALKGPLVVFSLDEEVDTGYVNKIYEISFELKEEKYTEDFLVLCRNECFNYPNFIKGFIGVNFLKKHKCQIDFGDV